ncbi:MAG: DNA mismatch repair protein MutS [Thermoanaerobaculia bacterium]
MKQYLSLKEKAKDCVLLFRLGDFYELFFEDAIECAPLLQIALTTRDGEIPMCGIPYHSLENYLPKLLNAGKKIALAEQMEEPGKGGIVRREIVQVLTPGLSIEEEERVLACLYYSEENWWLAFLNIGARKLKLIKFKEREELQDFIQNEPVKELLFPEGLKIEEIIPKRISINCLPSDYFNFHIAKEEILKTLKVQSLRGLNMEDGFIPSLGALFRYVKETLKEPPKTFGEIEIIYEESEVLPPSTLRNLEIFKTLEGERKEAFFNFFDKTLTPMGRRTLKEWMEHPLKEKKEILKRQEVVSFFLENKNVLKNLQNILKNTPDIPKILGKLELGREHPREVLSLGQAVFKLKEINNLFSGDIPSLLLEILDDLKDVPEEILEVRKILKEDIPFLYKEGNFIKNGVSKELDDLRDLKNNSSKAIFEFEKREREKLKIPTLKIKYNKVFGYFIEVSKGQVEKVPENYIRKQTLVNAERYYTPQIKELEERIKGAEEKIIEIELKIYEQLREKIKEKIPYLLNFSNALGKLDSLLSMSKVAEEEGFTLPQISEERELKIIEGWHPVVSKLVPLPFVPNDCILNAQKEQIMIITGPNMGGKSTYLRQVGLICLLAQIGSFVPAKEASVPIFDHIFTRVGSADFLYRGESTFMVEMIEMARILRSATDKSLILIDEVGRGTSTFDGLSIAWATVEYLHNVEGKRGLTLFATHYHELTNLERELERVINRTFAVKEYKEKIIFLHKLIEGAADRSYGIEVARLAGIPDGAIERAKEILKVLEKADLLKDRNIKKTKFEQLFLFEPSSPVLEEIKNLKIEELTPLEALNLIAKWKKEI